MACNHTPATMARSIASHPLSSMPRIFEAALSGIVANPQFFGPEYQGRPDLAVDFALRCCIEIINAEGEA